MGWKKTVILKEISTIPEQPFLCPRRTGKVPWGQNPTQQMPQPVNREGLVGSPQLVSNYPGKVFTSVRVQRLLQVWSKEARLYPKLEGFGNIVHLVLDWEAWKTWDCGGHRFFLHYVREPRMASNRKQSQNLHKDTLRYCMKLWG